MINRNFVQAEPQASAPAVTEDQAAKRLVQDLHTPRPAIFWSDLLLTALIGWAAFIAVIVFEPTSRKLTVIAFVIAVLALYRGLCFLHEITHLRQSALRGYETSWNLLFGVPMLIPSVMYLGVHQNHHKLSTYGTQDDPEYLPFSGRPLMIALFGLESFLIPALLAVRFLVLSIFGLLIPKFHTWLGVHATALSMNVHYRREVSPALNHKIARWEATTLLVWWGWLGLAAVGVLPWRSFAVWYSVLSVVALINTLRTLGAHRYTSDGTPLDRDGQLGDSIDTPGALWTELWAPVGLRYHAMHHYFPGVPYHNLGEAYRRLVTSLPQDARYNESTSPSLPHSLDRLYRGDKT